MLDLQARVHLEEVEGARSTSAARVDQELDRARVAIADAARAAAPPLSVIRARSAGVSAGDGLSSMTF